MIPKRNDTIALSVVPVFAGKWLMPRLDRFSFAHPDIAIRVEATVALADPRLGEIDFCIRLGKGPWSGLDAERLLSHRVFPVCAPKIASKLASPKDILTMPVIREPAPLFGWEVWLDHHGVSKDQLRLGPVFSDASLCLDAARAGQGVFLAWDVLVAEDLATGRLIAPFRERHPTGLDYWLIRPPGAISPHLAKFRSWIRSEIALFKNECRMHEPGHMASASAIL
jgi:DNA-binding transcriptional LysR family regulator